MTSRVGMINDLRSSCPSIAATVRRASWLPISTVGCATVVSGGSYRAGAVAFVTETDQRDVVGHCASGVLERTQHAGGNDVGGSDDGVERRRLERAAACVAANPPASV